MVVSMPFRTEKSVVRNHPYIKGVLVYDIETDSLDTDVANMKFFGAYSYKYEKYYILDYSETDKIQFLLDNHRVLFGWNIRDYDNVIMENNGYDLAYKIVFDGLRVLYLKDKYKYNRKPIIKLGDGRHLDAACKSNKLSDIARIIGCSVKKGSIDYQIFRKNKWTKEELSIIHEYLLHDLVLSREILEFFIDYFDGFRDLVGDEDIRNFNYIRSSTGSFAYAAISKAINEPARYPDERGVKTDFEKYEGGFVLPPVHEYAEDVVYFDFASLYPHIEIMCNLFSPVPVGEGWSGGKLFSTFGCYNDKEHGKIEKALHGFYLKRQALKQAKDMRELAYKIVINSIYGISAVPIFLNVYNRNVARDTTRIAQDMLKHTFLLFERNGFKIIAADTDSVFVHLNGRSREDALRVADEVNRDILSNVPFPVSTFGLKVDDDIRKIWFPGKLKKHYAYLTIDGKFKVKGLDIIKGDASLISQKIFKLLVPLIRERGDMLFDKSYIEGLVSKFIRDDISVVGRLFKVKSADDYNSDTNIQAQIARVYGEGEHLLIPNKRLGSVGKSKKYCDISMVDELVVEDLFLDKVWKELSPFIK